MQLARCFLFAKTDIYRHIPTHMSDAMDMNLGRLQEMVRDRRPGMLQSMGSQRVGHDWLTEHHHTHPYTFTKNLILCILTYMLLFSHNTEYHLLCY